jgi:hypothetical protein
MAEEQPGYIDRAWNWATDTVQGLWNGAVDSATKPWDAVAADDNTLSQSRYDFTYRAFPSDLGMEYAGHYMVININVPITVDSARFGGRPEAATQINPRQFTMLENEFSKVDVLRFSRAGNTTGGTQSDSMTSRRTRRIVESIALYMPGTQLVYNGMNTYEEISMTALGGQILTGAIGTAAGLTTYFGGSAIGGVLANLIGRVGVADAASQVAGAAGSATATALSVAGTAAKLAGRPINPRVEVLFSLTPLRDFQFEFLMIPRNAEEAESINRIVRTLRFHAAPELDNLGFQFIPPAEFDITFFYNGTENNKIPRINTCVLTRCEVDYAPGTGIYSTFHDGTPIATRLMLVFREIEPVHKLRVLQGF